MIKLEKIERKQTYFYISIDENFRFGHMIEVKEPAGLLCICDISRYEEEYNILFVSKNAVNGNKSKIYCPRKDLTQFRELIDRINKEIEKEND